MQRYFKSSEGVLLSGHNYTIYSAQLLAKHRKDVRGWSKTKSFMPDSGEGLKSFVADVGILIYNSRMSNTLE